MSSPANSLSFSGRIARKPYWLLVGIFLGFRILAAAVVQIRPDLDFLNKTDFLLGFIGLVVGKRMRDFGVSAVWGWIAVALVSFVLPIIVVLTSPRQAGALEIPTWLGLLSFASLTSLIVGVGLRKGDAGPNRYGEPPAPA